MKKEEVPIFLFLPGARHMLIQRWILMVVREGSGTCSCLTSPVAENEKNEGKTDILWNCRLNRGPSDRPARLKAC